MALFYGLEEFQTAGLLQQLADLFVELAQREEGHVAQGIVDALVGKVDSILHQRLVLWGISTGGVCHTVVVPGKVLETAVDIRLITTGTGYGRL